MTKAKADMRRRQAGRRICEGKGGSVMKAGGTMRNTGGTVTKAEADLRRRQAGWRRRQAAQRRRINEGGSTKADL